MRYSINDKMNVASVYLTHKDQDSEEVHQELNAFIADCKLKRIFVCVFESGSDDLLANTKELLVYNYNNAITHTKTR